MKTNKLPFIRWYASDFLTGIRGLKAFQIGIYTVLLNEMYERCAPLPINFDKLAWQCGCTRPVFIKTLSMLKAEGKIMIKDGGLWNDRVEIEFNYRQNKILAAKTGANARWKKPNENKAAPSEPQCGDDAVAMPSQKPETRSKDIGKDISKDIPKKPSNKKGCRIDEKHKHGDQIPDDYFAAATRKGLDPDRIDSEFEKFIDYWTAASGSKAVKRSWLATWRSWVANSIEWSGSNGPNRNGPTGSANASPIDAANKIIAEGLSL